MGHVAFFPSRGPPDTGPADLEGVGWRSRQINHSIGLYVSPGRWHQTTLISTNVDAEFYWAVLGSAGVIK